MHTNYTNASGLRTLQAKLRYQFAWASHQMDVRCRALDNIAIALDFDPDNDFYNRIQQDWLEEEAQQPHGCSQEYPEACLCSSSRKLAQSNRDG